MINMMKKSAALFGAAVLAAVGLTACGPGGGGSSSQDPGKNVASVWDPYTPFDETISFTKGTTVLGTGGLPDGDSYENNVFTRYLLKTQNIKTVVEWEVDSSTYDQKVALSIASRQIPDVLVVNRSTFKQLVENDLAADMTEAYEKCISPFLKEQLDGYGEKIFTELTVDGKLMGLPSPSLNDCHNVLWIRKDWLDKAGLAVPETVDDVGRVAKAFIDKRLGGDSTVGLTTVSGLYNGYNTAWGLDTIFSAFGAYPGEWLELNGKAAYGSIQPEVKTALAKMREWYAGGILDREFAVRDESGRQSLIGSGKCGMYFGVWWPSNGVPDSVELDKSAEWVAVSAPVGADGKLHTAEHDPLQKIVVVSKSYSHPEAIVKALNAGYDALRCNLDNPYADQTKEAYDYFFKTSPQAWGVMPVPIEINAADCVGRGAEELDAAVKAEDPSLLKLKGFEASYQYILYNSQHPKENRVYYHEYLARIVGASAAGEDNKVIQPTCFYGTTRTMSTLWSSLKKMENDMMLKVVMGEAEPDAFDDFVTKWLNAGGQRITDEVEDARVK